jgi:hypothetical protein
VRTSLLLGTVIVLIGFVTAPFVNAAEEPSPCGGAHFVEHLGTISFVSNALKLLSGSESPRLRRLLEWRLSAAGEDAKVQLDRGVVVEAVGLPTYARGLREARAYAFGHNLPATVIANLTALEEWVSKQPRGPSAPPR